MNANQIMLSDCKVVHACVHNVDVSSCAFVLFCFGACGRSWEAFGDAWGISWGQLGHFRGILEVTGHGKRTDDKTWCAMNMGFSELLIFLLF